MRILMFIAVILVSCGKAEEVYAPTDLTCEVHEEREDCPAFPCTEQGWDQCGSKCEVRWVREPVCER